MSEYHFNLTGWKAMAVVVVLIGVVGVRLMTLSDKKDDNALMRAIELRLMTDYLPDDVEELKDAYEAGDTDKVERATESIRSTKLDVESVQASYPLLDFSSPRDVVIKVRYSINDDSGTREKGTHYYLFEQGSLGNVWKYKHKTSIVSYYLNFK